MDQSKEEKIYEKSILDFDKKINNTTDSDSDIDESLDNSSYNKRTFLKLMAEKEYLHGKENPILLKFTSDKLTDDEQFNFLKTQPKISPCPPNKVLNPKTGRCIKIPSEKQKTKKEPKPCPPDKIINPKTGRCIKISPEKQEKLKEPKPCPVGKIRNPETGRCITIKKSLAMPIINLEKKMQLENIPQKSFNKNTFSVMLAKNYTPDIDPSGYYLSEKLDGIRAVYHDGEYISRTNKPFYAPKWFSDHYPSNIVFDGELFTKRKDFKGIMSIATKKIPIDSEWDKVVYMVFDLPTVKLPFEERYELLKNIVDEINISGNMHINYVNQYQIKNMKELDEIHKQLTLKGAEGTMLRKPQSSYENIRSKNLLKVKDFFDDEAVVEDFEFGDGRNSTRMGNLIVKWLHPGEKDQEGNVKTKGTFNIGSGFDDYQRTNYKTLFPKGTIIKIKYGELQESGKPRFPVYLSTIPKKFAH
jgi:DNA ligase-1